jgi:hypothetical protein
MNRASLLLLMIATFFACGDDGPGDPPPARDGGVRDGGGTSSTAMSLDSCFETVAQPVQGFVEIQDLVSADEAIRLRIARQPGDRTAVGETWA